MLMKKRISIWFAFIIFVGLAAHTVPSTAEASKLADNADGWWILHEYHDRIMNNRCIGEFSFEVPVASSIIIKVSDDSVFSWGSVFPRRATARSQGDTLTIIRGMHNMLPLMNSQKKNELLLTCTTDSGKVSTFHYRRMSRSELTALTKGLDADTDAWQLNSNYQQFFQEQFFTGTFTGLNGTSFSINAKGEVQGFEKWNTCSVDNFFGTTHWNGKRDRVRFEDNTGSFVDYNYKGDTLILRKFIGPDIEQYRLSKEEVWYVRSPFR